MSSSGSRFPHPIVQVLLVEENADAVSAISALLSDIQECRLRVSSSFADALLSILEKPPHLILFTHGLPGRDSLEVFASIRKKYPSIHLIVILPAADQDLSDEYKKAGTADCISKDANYPMALGLVVKQTFIQILAASAGEKTPFLFGEESGSSDGLASMLSALEPGETILHYRIIDAIGEGGMGEVYKAQDLKLGRTVAIKSLPLATSKKDRARRRFLREAQSASKLNHSGIVTIHAIEEVDDFQYIVMEYVEGESLREVVKRGPMQLNRVMGIGCQIADALEAAHSAGLIHRDIKPANIMISSQDKVKILDFGLAKAVSEAGDEMALLTIAGSVLGTVSYMSPEQSRGETLDARTDIFSMGCVLYQAATGKLPFHGTDTAEIMHEIATNDPPPPSSINPKLPLEFDSLIARATNKDKTQRFASAEQMATALVELKYSQTAPVAGSARTMNTDAISHYKITGTLGQGGMGVVYKAIDQKLGRPVAIKTLPRERIGDENLKKRLMSEARAASKLNHPNICTIYEVDEVDGNLFIAMEYIQGHTLSEEMLQGPLGFEKALGIAVEIASGLEKAHRENIVHRDIKPSNIALTEEGRVKILDFGLAQVVEKVEAEAVTKSNLSLTEEGQVVGTIAYMSPEQLKGQQVDARTDIFSFGILLYEMLRGQRPFRGSTSIQLMHSILNDHPEPFGANPTDLTSELDRIIQKSLAKDREGRYATMKNLLDDLVKLKERLKEPAQAKDQDSIAVLYFENLGGLAEQEYLRDGLTEDVITELSKVERLRVFPRSAVIAFRDKSVTAPEIGRQLNASHVLVGSLRKAGNRVRVTAQLIRSDSGHSVWAERYDCEMQDVFDLQDEIARSLATALSIKLTPAEDQAIGQKPAENPEAYDFYLRGRRLFRRGTRKDMESAAEMFQQAIALEPNFALAFAGLGHVCGRIHRYHDQNPQWMERGIEACEKAMRIEPNLPEALSARAFLLYGHKEYEEAIRYARMALERKKDCEGAYFVLGLALNLMDRLEETVRLVDLAIEFNGDDYNVYLPYITAFTRLGDEKRRKSLMQQLFRVLQLHLEWAPENARARVLLSCNYAEIGDVQQALDELSKALAYSPNDASTLMNAACAYGLLGRKTEALATLKKAVDNGYRHADTIARDPDLNCLHDDPEFQALLKHLSQS